jgi:hypothetical protein
VPTAPSKPLSPRGARWFGIIFAAFACLFIAIGSVIAAAQAAKLNGYLAIPATVTGAEVQTTRSSKSTTSAPLVHFTYQVAGAAHTAHTPFPLDTSSSGDWANEVVGRYHAGQQVTAWYNPAAPDQAYLERTVDVFPYLFILFPMLHLCIGLAVWGFAGSAGLDPAGKARRMGAIVVLWWLVGLLAAAHFASLGGAFRGLALGAFAAYAAIGGGLLLGWSALARAARVAGGDGNPYAPPSA